METSPLLTELHHMWDLHFIPALILVDIYLVVPS